MAGSVLLNIVRESMLEVYQAKRIIQKELLLENYPILSNSIECTVSIYLKEKKKNTYTTSSANTLLENIIICAKKAAFEDPAHPPLSSSNYLLAEIELTLHTDDGDISEKDSPILTDETTLVV
ncbi:MAG: AMMECR1 domain-containing protein [Epsilonproteobacteria bacterium]|nr:AMMECR1 domain-containing protein [Campylobacterota bacterium]